MATSKLDSIIGEAVERGDDVLCRITTAAGKVIEVPIDATELAARSGERAVRDVLADLGKLVGGSVTHIVRRKASR